MNNRSSNLTAHYKWRGLLKTFGKIVVSIICSGLALLLGFWLVIASNMGPTYLLSVCNGCLDHWIRMVLLGAGVGIWLTTAVGLIFLILRYFFHSTKCNR